MKEAKEWVVKNYPEITKPSEQIKLMDAYMAGKAAGMKEANDMFMEVLNG